jgi:hypothetical protein
LVAENWCGSERQGVWCSYIGRRGGETRGRAASMAGCGGAPMPSVFIHFLEKRRQGGSVREGKVDDNDSTSFLHGAREQMEARCGGGEQGGAWLRVAAIWCRVSGEDEAGEVLGRVATWVEGQVSQRAATGPQEKKSGYWH